jgi:hypothetical protein
MSSGPVVISDDGSPPPGLLLAGVYNIKVGLQGEPMAELLAAGTPHTFLTAFEISRVHVTRGGNSLLMFFNPGTVTITGKGVSPGGAVTPANIVVVSGGGKSFVDSPLEGLTDVSSGSFSVYQSVDTKIKTIKFDDVTIDVSGTSCKVELYF